MTTSRLPLVGLTAALLATVSLTTYNVYGADATVPPAATAAAAARTIGTGDDSYADVVDRVAPTVVTIRSERRVRAAQQFPFMDDPVFRDFFGGRMPGGEEAPAPTQRGLGSGVIVRPEGYILTNHHVIDGAEEITVELSDRRSFQAELVGSDPPSDLAVLKIDGGSLPAIALADSDAVRVGDVVLAVGNPMGVGQTVTMGIISAKGRSTGLGDGSFEDFLQTDAPINQGNSGGALVNTRGELVGINSQILSPSGGNIGIGFAIPADMAGNVMEALMADGYVSRGMLGVTVQPVTPDIALSLELEEIRGALISDVADGSAAERAGLERGDVVVALNGEAIDDSNALRNHVARLGPGARARLTIVRGGRERDVTATLDELPSAARASGPAGDAAPESAVGLSVRAEDEGLLVTAVAPAGPAARAGFQRGDVILEVNGRALDSAGELREAFADAGDRPTLVLVRRGEATIYLTVDVRRS